VTLSLLILLLSLGAFAPTTTTYESSTGKVSPSNQLAGNLDLGGSFVSAYGMGAGCYYGGCPDWTFFNYPLSYALQDGISESPEKANRLPCLLKYLECAQNPQRPSTNTTP